MLTHDKSAKKGGGGGLSWDSSAYLLLLIVGVRRLNGHICNNKRTVGVPGEEGSNQITAGSHLPVVPKKLFSFQSAHTQNI